MTPTPDRVALKHRRTWAEGSRIIVETAPYGETWPVRTVIDTDSQAIRNVLIQMGWTPPAHTDGYLFHG